MSKELFKSELNSKIEGFLDEEKIKVVKDAAETYFGLNNTVNGREFFERVILDAPKDYPTDDMRFYQAVTELKSRLGRIFDDSIALQKLEIEKELLELDIQEMEISATTRRDELNLELKRQDLIQKNVRIGFAKESLMALAAEIEDFKIICDKYKASGNIKPFQVARLEEMNKKKKMLFLAHILGNKRDLSPSELSFFMQDNGTIKPPEGVEDDLLRLGQPHLAEQVKQHRELIERAELLKLEGKVEAPQLGHNSVDADFDQCIDIKCVKPQE